MPQQQSDNSLGIDPATMAALQMQEQSGQGQAAALGGNSAERLNDAAVFGGMNTLFPSPQVQQQREEMTALKSATQTQNPGESDVDFAMRQLKAQRDAIVSLNPAAANKINTQLLLLGQQKFENDQLLAEGGRKDRQLGISQENADTDKAKIPIMQGELGVKRGTLAIAQATSKREQQQFDAEAPVRKQTADRANLRYMVADNPDAKPGEMPFTFRAYDVSDPEDRQNYLDARTNPNAAEFTADKMDGMLDGQFRGDMRYAAALAKAQLSATGAVDPDTAKNLARMCLPMGSCPGLPKDTVASYMKELANAGIDALDRERVKLEFSALQNATNVDARRMGNMMALEGSMHGLGQEVISAMQDMGSRGDWKDLNDAIFSGSQHFSDPKTARYQAALQSFVNEYARVIAGGIGVTTDSARADAHAMLNTGMGPQAVLTAVKQLADRETQIIGKSTSDVLDVLNQKDRYPVLNKALEKLGGQILHPSGPVDQGQLSMSPTAAAQPPQIAPQPGQPAMQAPPAAAPTAAPPQAPPPAQMNNAVSSGFAGAATPPALPPQQGSAVPPFNVIQMVRDPKTGRLMVAPQAQ